MEYDALHVLQRSDEVGPAGSVGSCWSVRRQVEHLVERSVSCGVAGRSFGGV